MAIIKIIYFREGQALKKLVAKAALNSIFLIQSRAVIWIFHKEILSEYYWEKKKNQGLAVNFGWNYLSGDCYCFYYLFISDQC